MTLRLGLQEHAAYIPDDNPLTPEKIALGKQLFGLEAHLLPREGYTEVSFHSVALTIWWDACGFAKQPPFEGHSGIKIH